MKLLRWPSLVAEEKYTNSKLLQTNGTFIKKIKEMYAQMSP
jgi:hypothetical protein